MTTRVLCLGGGYAAIWLTRAMKQSIQQGKVELTIVSRDNFQTFHGAVAEMLTGKIRPTAIANPARRIFYPARLHNAEIESIDLEKRTVHTNRPLDGRQYHLPYDHLILAVGSVDDLSRYPGIAEHAFKLKTFWDCFKVRNHLLNMFEMAEIEPDPEERQRLLTFVVAGGNYAGIEVACELEEYFETLSRKEYKHLQPSEIRLILVHAGESILPELAAHFPRLVEYAQRYIGKLRMEVRLKRSVAAATPDEVILSDGERIPTRTLISCTGIAMSPLLNGLPFQRDTRGRVETDEFLRVRGAENTWAAGDCAAIPHPRGGTCPPLATYALSQGEQIGRNIVRMIEGSSPAPYRFTGIGDACSLARRHAVAHVRGVPFTGLMAWIGWRSLMLVFVPSWERRAQMVFDWFTWPLFGREVVNMKVEEHLDIETLLFEPGQVIVRQGEVGRRLFVIQSGEVEIIREEAGAPVAIGTLGPGEHFGEMAVFQKVLRTATVRARTRVHLLAIGREAAHALSASVSSFSETLHQLPHTSPAVKGREEERE